MAGIKTNTITYTFDGNTLGLEQAIKKVQSLLKDAQKNLVSYQKNGINETQRERIAQLKKLEARLQKAAEKGTLTPKQAKATKAAGQKALTISKQLSDQGLRAKQKSIDAEKKLEEKKAEESAKAVSEAGQVKAHAQVTSLSRLSNFLDQDDPTEKALYNSIQGKINAYKQAESEMDGSKEKTEALAKATLALNEAYKEAASSLTKLESEQRKSQGKGKGGFLDYIFNKAKSLAVYRLLRDMLMKIVQEFKKSFDDIAEVSQPFNDSMSELTSSFKYLMNSIASFVAPLVQMLTPVLTYLAQIVGEVSSKLAELFSAMAGNDSFAKATYQVEDYAASLKKANSVGKIDELNKVTTKQNNFQLVDIKGQENLKGFKSLLDSITTSIKSLIEPLMKVLIPALQVIADILSLVGTLFGPIIEFVSWIAGGILSVVGDVLVFVANVLHTMISHLEILIPLAASFLTLWAVFNWKAVIAGLTAMIANFKALALKIWNAIIAAKNWIVETVKSIAMNIKNAISAWVAEKAYWKLALAIIAAAGMLAAVVAGIVMTAVAMGSATMAANEGSNPAVAMATGGVVMAPTLALVGEGKYPEAVVPLGDSPQFKSMKEGIASEVVNLIGSTGGSRSSSSDRQVVLNIDGRTLARALWPNLVETQNQVGVKLK